MLILKELLTVNYLMVQRKLTVTRTIDGDDITEDRFGTVASLANTVVSGQLDFTFDRDLTC